MTQAEFRDALRILRTIKYRDLEDAGVFADAEFRDTLWQMFRADPCRTFVLVSDKIAENVWSIVERRMLSNILAEALRKQADMDKENTDAG